MQEVEMITRPLLPGPGSSWLVEISARQSMHPRLLHAGRPAVFHKVPPDVRLANPTDYDPMFFTFGPCHAKFQVPLSSCDVVKVQIAHALTSPQTFATLQGAIESRDGDIRKIYEEYLWELRFDLEPQVLAYLLALDALTIVAAALYPSVLAPRRLRPVILRDAMLLEQQLPLFILRDAIKSLVVPPHEDCLMDGPLWPRELFRRLVCFYAENVSTYFPIEASPSEASEAAVQSRICQLLASPSKETRWEGQSLLSLIYHTLLNTLQELPSNTVAASTPSRGKKKIETWEPTSFDQIPLVASMPARGKEKIEPLEPTSVDQVPSKHKSVDQVPSASELRRWGIRFEANKGGFRGIKFDAGMVLKLPEITVYDDTKAALLNLAAQEGLILLNEKDFPVTSYINVMDDLINTEEDVQLLVEKEVIHNKLGSHKELAEMWNTLAVNLPAAYTQSDSTVMRNVSKASKRVLRRCWAGFHDTYFNKKPWLFISLIAGSCLFVLTFLQTTFTIMQYNTQE